MHKDKSYEWFSIEKMPSQKLTGANPINIFKCFDSENILVRI